MKPFRFSLRSFLKWQFIGVVLFAVMLGGYRLFATPAPRNWDVVVIGASKSEVRAAIGNPDWIEDGGHGCVLWAYREEGGISGWFWPTYLLFNAEGKVTGNPWS